MVGLNLHIFASFRFFPTFQIKHQLRCLIFFATSVMFWSSSGCFSFNSLPSCWEASWKPSSLIQSSVLRAKITSLTSSSSWSENSFRNTWKYFKGKPLADNETKTYPQLAISTQILYKQGADKITWSYRDWHYGLAALLLHSEATLAHVPHITKHEFSKVNLFVYFA